MKKILSFLIVCCSCISSSAQTNITTSIYTSTTWTIAGSPYVVVNDVVIFTGVTLTIDPGVEVQFCNGREMDLRGKLIALGTATDSITFTSNVGAPYAGIWAGIRVTGTGQSSTNQVTMKYCKGLYSDRFMDMDLAYEGPYVFEHCSFRYNNYVTWDGGAPYVRFSECDFISNDVALDHNQFGGVVRLSRFMNNHTGVQGFSNVDTCYFSGHTGIALSPYGAAVGNTIENNNIGVRCYFNAVNDTFMYNTVRDNTVGVEIQSYFNGSIHFTQNWLCNNTQYNVKLFTANNADLSNNCWCSKDEPSIRNTIYDGYVNTAYGLVTYLPVSTTCPLNVVSVEENNAVYNPVVVYPNPSSGVFYLQSELNGAPYSVYNVTGQEITTGTLSATQLTLIDLGAEAAGIYFIRVMDGDRVYTQKILRE